MLKKIASNLHSVEVKGCTIFYSYETAVAIKTPSGLCFCTDKKYSATTSRHINKLKEMYEGMHEVSQAALEELLRGVSQLRAAYELDRLKNRRG